MSKLLSEEIVEAVTLGDKEGFMSAFHSALAAKVSDALELKKVEIASTLVAPASNEVVEEEVKLDEEEEKPGLKISDYPHFKKYASGALRARDNEDVPDTEIHHSVKKHLDAAESELKGAKEQGHDLSELGAKADEGRHSGFKRAYKTLGRIYYPFEEVNYEEVEGIEEAKGESRISWRARTPEEIAKSDKRRKVKVTSAELEARAKARRAEKSE
jgi:hypothetical protein